MANKRKWLWVITIVAVIGFLMVACSKADPETDFRYEPSDDGQGMVITGYNGNNVNVVIPAKIQKLPVVGVGGFSGTNIISVVIPASTKEIASRAFRGCQNLTSIVIPTNVKKIGNGAFQNCTNLTSVTFKGKDAIIGEDAFQNCRNLEKLVFPDGALKPFKHDQALGPQDQLGRTVFRTEHYFYNPGSRNIRGEREYVFYFNSGTSAFYGCDKLPAETISKLNVMGFLSPEELRELERKAQRGELH